MSSTEEHISNSDVPKVAALPIATAAIVLANDEPACRRAADRLKHCLQQLFGFQACDRQHGDVTFHLRCDGNASPQDYAIGRIDGGGGHAYELVGGSPEAINWAVSELAEFWGVRFLTTRDVFPDDPGPFRMPDLPLMRTPVLRRRGVRIYNDWPNDPCRWPLSDIETFIDQLAKMRINEVGMAIRPYDPFWRFEWRGARKDLAVTNYGFHLPIDQSTIGFPLFQASGDAARGSFANPDLDCESDFDQTIAAGQHFLKRIRAMSRDHGMRLSAMVIFSDFPEPIKRRLAELSQGAFQTDDDCGQVTRMRYGLWNEGPTREMAQVMSIRNPLYLDLLRCYLASAIEALADFDNYYLWPSEFRGSAADAAFAWDDLDKRFQLHEITSLDALIAQARATAEVGADRAEHELRADVSALWIFDHLLNQHPVPRPASLAVCPSGLNPALHEVIARIFNKDQAYLGHIGYMPTTISRHADTFEAFQSQVISVTVVTTLEDDNIGPVFQESTPSVAALVQVLTGNGLDGFMTRQWNYSKVMPALHYLTHAAWDRRFSPDDAAEHLFAPSCGERAMPALAQSIELLRDITSQMQSDVICPAFLSPHLISGRWTDESAAYFGSADNKTRDQHILERYERAAQLLDRSADESLPAGRTMLAKMQKQAAFACAWMKGIMALATAVELRNQSAQADRDKDVDTFDRTLLALRDHLAVAAEHIHEATRCWADTVEDRADLGTLAALNEYGVKSIDAIRHLVNLDAMHWSRSC